MWLIDWRRVFALTGFSVYLILMSALAAIWGHDLARFFSVTEAICSAIAWFAAALWPPPDRDDDMPNIAMLINAFAATLTGASVIANLGV